jgi:hypothetical protein
MKKSVENKELNRTEKRAIEALAIAPVIRAVSQRIGRDEARGFNPQLKLVRTKTIMEGADHCDFRYYLRAK